MSDPILQTIRDAENILSQTVNKLVQLELEKHIHGNFTVLQCRTSLEDISEIVIKQIPLNEVDSNKTETKIRFLNELAALQFTNQIAPNITPSLLAFSVDKGILITQYLGDLEDVHHILNQTNTIKARYSLCSMYCTFATLHGQSFKHIDTFKEIQNSIGAQSPPSDSLIDYRHHKVTHMEFLEYLQFTDAEIDQFLKEFYSIETHLFEDKRYHCYIHADSGPQNVLISDHSIILDHEYGGIGNFALDIVGHRLGFPQSWKGRIIPVNLQKELETVYFDTITSYCDITYEEYQTNLYYAACHWMLGRFLNLKKMLVDTWIQNANFLEELPRTSEHKQQLVWNLFSGVSTFEDLLHDFTGFELFSEFIRRVKDLLIKIFGKEYKEPMYPAFVSERALISEQLNISDPL